METSHPLSIESFSFKWIINLNSSFDGLGESFRAALESSDEAAFIEMDLRMATTTSSSRRFLGDVQEFKFPTSDDTSSSSSSSSSSSMFVHADEVFSNGLLLPFLSKQDTLELDVPISLEARRVGRSFLKRCWKSWKRIVGKHVVGCVKPKLSHKHKVGDSDFRAKTNDACVHVWEETLSGRSSTECLFRRDWSDIEKSIQEAVLHCRMSFEK